MVSTPDFIGHHTFWLRHLGWCSLWYPRGRGFPARYLRRSHSTYKNPWRLSAHRYRDFLLNCHSPVAARPCEATWLLSSFRIWRAGATLYLSLSPPLYVVNEGGKGSNPRFAYRSGACKYTTACEHASMSPPGVLWPTRCHRLQNIPPFRIVLLNQLPTVLFSSSLTCDSLTTCSWCLKLCTGFESFWVSNIDR